MKITNMKMIKNDPFLSRVDGELNGKKFTFYTLWYLNIHVVHPPKPYPSMVLDNDEYADFNGDMAEFIIHKLNDENSFVTEEELTEIINERNQQLNKQLQKQYQRKFKQEPVQTKRTKTYA